MTLIVSSNLYGLYPYELATRSLLSGFSAPNRVAFTLYCVAPTNSEYRDSPSVSTDSFSFRSTVSRSFWSR